MSTVEGYHRAFLDILRDHAVTMAGISADGHHAIRALIEEIHDQGYVLGQLHADGIFPEGEEADVAAREDRLKIPELRAQARSVRQGQGVVDGIRPHIPMTLEQAREREQVMKKWVQENPVDVDRLKADLEGQVMAEEYGHPYTEQGRAAMRRGRGEVR